MIRINLLPPEITQKRKDEQRWRWIVLGGVLGVVVVVAAFLILQVQVTLKQDEVAAVTQKAQELRQQSARFQVFQEKRSDLEARRAIAEQALAGRMDWARIFSEIALVVPNDLYLLALKGTEPEPATGDQPPGAAPGVGGATVGALTMNGKALDYAKDVPDLAYKSVAKLLVRLAELDNLSSVWMSSANKQQTSQATEGADTYIDFAVVADVTVDETATAGAAGAPPPAP